uniref:Beta-1,4-N-acetylgalactosaminyltransferase n=1 Tax=Romanomermis culicivorax TaxID=13658 RepID=A0A915HUY8_ROMCU
MAVGSKNNIPSIKCRNCEQKFGTCDYGECEGQSCVTIEVSHAQTRMVVKKTCSREIRSKSECLVTYPDGIESIQCYCTYDFCNSDGELAKIGLGQRKWLPEYLTGGRQRQKSKNINHKDYIRTNSQRGAARRYSNGSSYMGQLPVPMLLSVADVDYALVLNEMEKKHSDVDLGGHWSPKFCRPRRRLAIIVPYRNRAKHLVVLLNELHDILKRQLSEYRVFVAEQYKNLTYNKALLMNYAFTVINEAYPSFDCFIFHDVDLLPEDDTNLYECGHNPKHMSPSVDTLHYRLEQSASHEKSGEDDDIYIRVISEGYQVERPPFHKGRYRMSSHVKRNTIERQILRKLYNTSAARYKEDGLNQLPFMNLSLVGVRPRALFTHLMIDVGPPVDMEDIFDALFAFA